jgi:hypothetical protein
MEPRPLLEEDATEVESALLRAARADGPRKDVAARALAAIQGLAPSAGLPDAGSAVVERAAIVKWARIALVVIGVGGAATIAHRFGRPRTIAQPSLAPVPAATPSEASPAPAIADVWGPREEALVREPRRVSTGRSRDEGSSLSESSLGKETMLLDRAREGLDAHRGGQVLRLLDQYERRFPHGHLRPEAMVLRLAALLQSGRTATADSLATRLLADETYKPYAPRIQSLLREAKP